MKVLYNFFKKSQSLIGYRVMDRTHLYLWHIIYDHGIYGRQENHGD